MNLLNLVEVSLFYRRHISVELSLKHIRKHHKIKIILPIIQSLLYDIKNGFFYLNHQKNCIKMLKLKTVFDKNQNIFYTVKKMCKILHI